jgi:hypothetical protein
MLHYSALLDSTKAMYNVASVIHPVQPMKLTKMENATAVLNVVNHVSIVRDQEIMTV